MASYAAFTAIKEYLTANWTTTPLVWENDPHDPESTAPWVRVGVTSTIYQQESIGAGSPTANRWVEAGIIYFSVNVVSGSGTELARSYADTLIGLFRGLQLNDFEFTRMAIGMGQLAEEDGNWWGLPASVDWELG